MRLVAIAVAIFVLAARAAISGETAKPFPGNKPCPYPPQAQKEYVAGPVDFAAQVRADGTVESVEFKNVPLPQLGFEDAIRACIAEWRFEPGAAGEGIRRYDGHIRFRLAALEEAAIRALLEAFAAAWTSGDTKAVEDLALRPTDIAQSLPVESPPLSKPLEDGGFKGWGIALEPDLKYLRFLGPETVSIGQPIRRRLIEPRTGQTMETETLTLDVLAAKGSRGWRLVRVSPRTAWMEGVRVGGKIAEPRKIKNAAPRYPDIAKVARIQGIVILECLITPEGTVAAVRVLRGIPQLDQAAIDAVRQWVYAPTLVDGKPVPIIMTVTVNFRIS